MSTNERVLELLIISFLLMNCANIVTDAFFVENTVNTVVK